MQEAGLLAVELRGRERVYRLEKDRLHAVASSWLERFDWWWSRVGRMTDRVIKPVGRGFLFLDSHPVGCAQLVRGLAEQVEAP